MKQTTALDILKTGQNVFLTGQAGAGKTYVLNQYIHYLRVRGVSVAITASTGIASTHMNGMTIHAWAGMGIKDTFNEDDFKRLKSRQAVVDRLKDVKVLIVDEISMLHAKQVNLLDEILRNIRQNSAAFGGVQVVFSGDFFQLPPVGSKGESNKEKFAFMATAWKHANFQICYLSEQYRQSGHGERERFGMSLNDILNQIRHQDVDTLAKDILLSTRNHDIGEHYTRLYTHNANVDNINQEQLALLEGDSHSFDCVTYGEKSLIEMLTKNVKAAPTLTLKVGAQVMFVKNNTNLGVSNGTMGEVIDFVALEADMNGDPPSNAIKYPLVKLNNGRMVYAEPDEWTIEDNQGDILAGYSQVPLALAWAITIHKSQGMTLDAAEIDLSRTFEMGQGYVALSRLRSLDGLKLLGMNKNSLLLDEWVFHVNNRLLDIADEQAEKFHALDDETLADIHQKFIIACDGITDEVLIAHQEKLTQKLKAEQARLEHIQANQLNSQIQTSAQTGKTLDETLALIQDGLSLDEIAQKRGLAKSTIISHIAQLVKRDGRDDYLRFAPDDDELSAIKTIYDKLEAQGEFEGGIKLKPIVDMSEKGNGYYNVVRLALAFLDIDKANQGKSDNTQINPKTDDETPTKTIKDMP